ncbi:MAG: SpoIIIAH-like family protein [Candidatus Saccharibacteria bacterium]
MILKKRYFIIAGIILLLTAAILWLNNGQVEKDREVRKPMAPRPNRTVKIDRERCFFPQYRLQRDRVRGEQLDILKEIVNNPNTDEKSKQSALNRLLAITGGMEKEMKAEGLLKAEGFVEGVVILDNGQANIIVYSNTLEQDRKSELIKQISGILGLEQDKVNLIVKSPQA